ncbi:hypothetical protein GCM10009554_69640 [Kribbella koreensis]|uniref:Uncharacterized protein n=1 Tax=Kribbella koreensis TaxID=57909 RepID=A0ABP4C1V0_9ACTN
MNTTLAIAHATSSTTNDTLGVIGAALLVGLLLAYALLVLGALVSSLGAPMSGGDEAGLDHLHLHRPLHRQHLLVPDRQTQRIRVGVPLRAVRLGVPLIRR